MREELVSVLGEPVTGARLDLRDARWIETPVGRRIAEGTLVSTETGRTFPIVRGIPRFVDASNYTASFGLQWNHFRTVQIDSETVGVHSRQRFDAEAGWTSERLAGKWLLDAGCGAGRFAEIAASRSANVVALDMSAAVEAVSETLSRFPNCDVVQGSVLEPPIRRGSMDFAYCIGVAQHTPSPPTAVRQVVEAVKPGGEFCFTIYARQPWTKLNAKYLVRPLTKRLPKKVLLDAIERVMPVVYPVAERLFALPTVGRIARFAIPVAVYDEAREGWTREQRYQESVLDTFDMLSPQYDSPMTWGEVRTVLEEAHVKTFDFKSRVPVVVVGVR